MNYQLISAIARGIWAIDQETALGYAPLLNNIFGDSRVAFEFDRDQFKTFSIDRTIQNNSNKDSNKFPKGSIAIIPISGPLMKNDQKCGPVGMATIGKKIKEADQNSNIDGIILKIDSPGGTVDGTIALSEIVANTKKPIIAFADGLMASAALWIGSSADEIIAANKKTEIGSIGVLTSFADVQPAYEKMGVKFHTITAEQSNEKIKRWEELRAEKYTDFKKEVLNPLAEDFINHMKQNRPGIKEEQLHGKVYFAQDVIGSLVDSIGNFDYAINRMNELIDKKTNINNQPQKQMKKFEAINKALDVTELASTDEGVFLNEDQLEKINSRLAEKDQNEANLQTAQAAGEETQKRLDSANLQIQQLTAEMEELRNAAGATTATVVKDNDTIVDDNKDKNVVSDKKDFVENLNALAEEFGI